MQPSPEKVGGRTRDVRRRFGIPAICVFAVMVGTCTEMPGTFEQVRLLGTLKVATRNSPTAYYEGTQGPAGPEYELAAGFARRLGVELELRVASSGAAALDLVRHNRAHLAAAGIIANASRRSETLFGPVYQNVSQHVVYRVSAPIPGGPADLAGRRIVLVPHSTHAASLRKLADQVPGLVWQEVKGADQMELFAQVATGQADVTVADSSEFALGRHFYRDLRPAFMLGESEEIAWALAPRSTDLLPQVTRYFDELTDNGKLADILARNSLSLSRFDRVDAGDFVLQVQSRLEQLRPWFEQAAQAHQLDWRLLAAIGYQESRWDPAAISPTGVRGLMMLTAETAKRVGISDRSDPQQSIEGAARYLLILKATVPERIPEPDRSWFALAGYNVGFGHLEDARVLAQRQGLNPDVWDDVRQTLPLLAQERWYTQTRRGYARGWEPVGFVRNVQTYLEVLEWMTGSRDGQVRNVASVP